MRNRHSLTVTLVIIISLALIFAENSVFADRGKRNVRSRSWAKFLSISHEEDNDNQKITLLVEKEVPYKHQLLGKDAKKNLPFRLYFTLDNTRISKRTKTRYRLENSSVTNIRVGQFKPNTTRIVLDLGKNLSPDQYRVTTQKNPFSIIIELTSANTLLKNTAKEPTRAAAVEDKEESKRAIAQKPPSKIDAAKEPFPAIQEQNLPFPCTVVIDPGHGGKDPGATGHNGLQEKDICLAIGLKLKRLLVSKLACKTILTRETDKFVSLKERTRIANENNADLFISIHANSHPDKRLTGIETYYLNLSSDDAARRVAARENFSTPEQVSDLELILFDLLQNSKINESSLFAGFVHNALVHSISKKYKRIRNLGVKQGPFTILVDAEMPCILIETAFISNPTEAKRLKSESYQGLLAKAIVDGISSFTSDVKTAYYQKDR
jgi:N-acetylmuramoyl-L-alanine amidase